jgi:16S rRNA (cytosine1402-N4)-methyltransferase
VIAPDFHRPVLCTEVIAGLAIAPNGYYVDATFGRGGHSELILQHLGPEGRLLAIDQDPAAVATAQRQPFLNDARFTIKSASFASLANLIEEQGWMGKVNGVLMDLGVSSPQLDDAARGFSFRQSGPLDMRMNPTRGESAADWLNRAGESEIAQVLREYGEERFSRRIARAIVASRRDRPLTDTLQLAALIADAAPVYEPNKHPATRSFQAIRIFINQELTALRAALSQCLNILAAGGRLVVISFHSLEDRIVKQFMQQQVQGDAPDKLPLREAQRMRRLKLVERLIRPAEAEIVLNPRARSARLRIAEKII